MARRYHGSTERSARNAALVSQGNRLGILRQAVSFTQLIFSLIQMCPVGANALRSSNTASATPAAVTFFRWQNRRVPHGLL